MSHYTVRITLEWARATPPSLEQRALRAVKAQGNGHPIPNWNRWADCNPKHVEALEKEYWCEEWPDSDTFDAAEEDDDPVEVTTISTGKCHVVHDGSLGTQTTMLAIVPDYTYGAFRTWEETPLTMAMQAWEKTFLFDVDGGDEHNEVNGWLQDVAAQQQQQDYFCLPENVTGTLSITITVMYD